MFGRHRHHHRSHHEGDWDRHYSRHPFGLHGGHHHHRGERRGGGGRMGRFFQHGDLRLVVLKLIADKPSHGYELIKAIETAVGGAYSPSPGVIYPTLTLLEETGFVSATETAGKKLYAVTPEGQDFLEQNQAVVDALFARINEAGDASAAFAPQIVRARENLKTALRLKLTAGALTPDQIAAVAAALDDAAKAIEQA